MSMTRTAPRKGGLIVGKHFTGTTRDVFNTVDWEERDIRVQDHKTGAVLFAQDKFRVPKGWSANAGQVVASKFAFGPEGQREGGVDTVIARVCNAIADEGNRQGYFRSIQDVDNFRDELTYLCLHQYGSFNSPVWFNVGIHQTRGLAGTGTVWYWDPGAGRYEPDGKGGFDWVKGGPIRTTESYVHPQGSACFIQSVDDNMESIMALASSEAMLFKHGSGTGTDLSALRSTAELLSTGGRPSGPVPFLKVYDRIAATIKSGGKTRRAAKMNTLRDWHPDILEFARCKSVEERKAQALIAAGYESDFNGDAYDTVAFQNVNLSVGISDFFIGSLGRGAPWTLVGAQGGQFVDRIHPAALWGAIADGTWVCGDPGVQFIDTINSWHTCPFSGPIRTSNPCSEFVFLDDSACNLASLRLTRFWDQEKGRFRIGDFRWAARIFLIAQDILVDGGSYPTEKICRNSHTHRPLGLGIADVGGLLMRMGLPYDSDHGRLTIALIAALLTGHSYRTSADMADEFGAFEAFEANREPMIAVMERHLAALAIREHEALHGASSDDNTVDLFYYARDAWNCAITEGTRHGYRNAQVSLIAPTGTIAFMMDCDTTGIEAAMGLVIYKSLAGGGDMTITNPAVAPALQSLGYEPYQVEQICRHVDRYGTVESIDHLGVASHSGIRPEHLPVFDCAMAAKGQGAKRVLSPEAHLMMMYAVQPFLSGAISKTVSVPHDTTPDQIGDIYLRAHQLGLKCVAIYRDGSKGDQPVSLDRPGEGDGLARCLHCHAPVAVPAGACGICPECGTQQGGCT